MAHRLDNLHRYGPLPLRLAAAWPEARRRVEAAFGDLSSHGAELPGATAHTVRATRGIGTHTESEVVIHPPDDEVPALLLIPARRTAPVPSVLALHPTNPAGKSAIARAHGLANRGYGFELAQRGYLVSGRRT